MVDHQTRLASGSFVRNAELAECGRRDPLAAFTLLELLVVVAVIGILAGLLSSAFSTAKARSQKVSCLSNLRQLQVAWRFYIDDNEDYLPLNKSMAGPLSEQFFGRLLTSNSWACGSPKMDVTSSNIIRGTLFAYAGKSVPTYRCPADRSTVVGRPDVFRTRSYSISEFMSGDDEGDPRVKSKDSELFNPSPERIFVLIEEHEDSSWLGDFWILPPEKLMLASSSANWTSTPSDRHNQGCNLTFADGHVEYWKWFWPKSVGVDTKLTANGHELRDLQRLQAVVPKP
jgi:prepilin-type processing-associated H-X9-DG protein/prepilin-type N-terminal cleavage/methylation domain-containing protein